MTRKTYEKSIRRCRSGNYRFLSYLVECLFIQACVKRIVESSWKAGSDGESCVLERGWRPAPCRLISVNCVSKTPPTAYVHLPFRNTTALSHSKPSCLVQVSL